MLQDIDQILELVKKEGNYKELDYKTLKTKFYRDKDLGNWVFYIEIPRNHFFTTVSNSKSTKPKAMKIPRRKILLKFPEINFFRPFNKFRDTMIFGVTTIRYISIRLR